MRTLHPKKQIIVDAAVQVLKEHTIEETTVRKIAAQAGLTTGALYHHYKNKDEILFDVITQTLYFTNQMLDDNKDHFVKKNKEDLLAGILTNLHYRLSDVDKQKLHLLLLTDVIAKNSGIMANYQTSYLESIESTAKLFLEVFEIENPEDNKALASILIAAIDGIAVQQALGVLPKTQDEMINTFLDFFMFSIQAYTKKK